MEEKSGVLTPTVEKSRVGNSYSKIAKEKVESSFFLPKIRIVHKIH